MSSDMEVILLDGRFHIDMDPRRRWEMTGSHLAYYVE